MIGVVVGACLTWIIGHTQQTSLWRRLRNALMDKRHVCLNEEFLMMRMLGETIRTSGFNPDVIFAISPGGGMIAEWLSRGALGDFSAPIPVRTVCVHSKRSGGTVKTDEAVVIDQLNSLVAGLSTESRVLLVNDISRGGETLRVAHQSLGQYFNPENVMTATLFCHRDARTKPRFHVVMTDKTIRFDWKEPQCA
ncbi:MAG: hypothetical protein IIB56_05795 [Planctomycetes bacterium]|nr:hypothetical protein [Planctomycetota bacterium]